MIILKYYFTILIKMLKLYFDRDIINTQVKRLQIGYEATGGRRIT